MMPLDNKHIEGMEEPIDQLFSQKFVDQVERARNSVCDEICQELGVRVQDSQYQDIRACYMNKRSVTKEKLCDWLETVCCILNSFAVPSLYSAVPLVERADQLKEEKISDQKTIIDLQKKMIEKNEVEIRAVQTVVKTEMSSYPSMLTKSCTASLAPKKLQAAVKNVADREDRSKSVIIYGLSEPTDHQEQLQGKVEEVLGEIGEKPLVRDCCRVGIKRASGKRPVKFSLSSSDHVAQVIRNARLLRTKEGYESVYICPDRTIEERKAYKKLVQELSMRRKSVLDKVHFIRNNKVVSIDRDSNPGKPGGS